MSENQHLDEMRTLVPPRRDALKHDPCQKVTESRKKEQKVSTSPEIVLYALWFDADATAESNQ